MLLTAWASWTRNVGGECRQNLNFWFHGVPLGDSCLQWLHYSWKQIIQSTKCYPVRLGNLQRISNRTISLSNTFNWILSQKCSTIKIRIFCKNDLLLEKNRPVNSFRIYNSEPHMCCVGKINSISWTTWNTTVHTEPSDGQYSAACRYFYKGIVTGSVVNDSLIKYPDCGLFRDCHREKRYLCAKCVTIYAIFMEYFLDVVPVKRRQSAIKWMDFIFP